MYGGRGGEGRGGHTANGELSQRNEEGKTARDYVVVIRNKSTPGLGIDTCTC